MKIDLTKTSSYHYHLPQELIAQYPLEKRSESRLLTLSKNTGLIKHNRFHQIIDYLKAGDVLVLNQTRVIPARLLGKKSTGAKVEIFLLNQVNDNDWECLVKPGRRLKPGSKVQFSDELSAEIIDYAKEGARIVRFNYSGNFFSVLEKLGKVPLPPYINREPTEADKKTYQTVYAKTPGSVAAPTAGLHFTDDLLNSIRNKGVILCSVELNVGLGTFRPVKSTDIMEHKMHSEYCSISQQTADIINKAKEENRRVISVGTTSTRTLESFASEGRVKSGAHHTDIFIYPGGRKLQIIDGLITNFHLPESTLLMLVCAIAGYKNIMQAYSVAVQEKYRFFSYGDAMLII